MFPSLLKIERIFFKKREKRRTPDLRKRGGGAYMISNMHRLPPVLIPVPIPCDNIREISLVNLDVAPVLAGERTDL